MLLEISEHDPCAKNWKALVGELQSAYQEASNQIQLAENATSSYNNIQLRIRGLISHELKSRRRKAQK